MMHEELGAPDVKAGERPLAAALITFVSFVTAGLIPMAPYLGTLGKPAAALLPLSVATTAVAFLLVGILRAIVTSRKWYASYLEILLVGTLAGGSAYLIGTLLHRIIGA